MTAASRRLRLSQPTVSAQIQALENSLGRQLFRREKRRLALTDVGQMVYRRADEIFSLGRDLVDAVAGQPEAEPRRRLRVGISIALPKLLAHRLLEPLTRPGEPLTLVCQEGKHSDLLARLAIHELDLLLSEDPVGPTAHVRAYNHLLGRCGFSVFAARPDAPQYRRNFPQSLHGAPFLMPGEGSALRKSIEQWLAERKIVPLVVGEIADSALTKIFGQARWGLFAMPSVEEAEILHQFDVELVGRLDGAQVPFYAISTERKVSDPLVRTLIESAKSSIFD